MSDRKPVRVVKTFAELGSLVRESKDEKRDEPTAPPKEATAAEV